MNVCVARNVERNMLTSPNLDLIPSVYIRTPLIESIVLQKYTNGRQIFLKLENCQPCGSFKLRGISELCKWAKVKGYTKVVCASSGNAGIATAYAAGKLGLQAHVVVPKPTLNMVVETIKQYGGTVEIFGRLWHEAHGKASEIALTDAEPCFLIHRFDDDRLWAGHSTVVDEIAQDIGPKAPSVIMVACGGGGIISGVVQGVRRAGWADRTKVVALETDCTASLNAALRAKALRPIELTNMESIVQSLAVDRVCDQVLKHYHEDRPSILSRTVKVDDAVRACLDFANHHRMLVGLATGTVLAAVYQGLVERILARDEDESDVIYDKSRFNNYWTNSDGPIVVIVGGGADTNLEELLKLKAMFVDQN